MAVGRHGDRDICPSLEASAMAKQPYDLSMYLYQFFVSHVWEMGLPQKAQILKCKDGAPFA